jgi:hypothetical protein
MSQVRARELSVWKGDVREADGLQQGAPVQYQRFPKDLNVAAVLALVWHISPKAGLHAQWTHVVRS